jgi:SAM-dependent methyltransferase/archaellum component FlaC
MSGDDRAASSDPPPQGGQQEGLLRRWAKILYFVTPWGLKHWIDHVGTRLDEADDRSNRIESAIRTLQDELAEIRDERLGPVEKRVDAVERALGTVSDETGRLRDEVFPASVARSDALLERLAEELEETASLVERSLLGEPLPIAGAGPIDEGRLSDALNEVQPVLLESFRGSDEEIRHRLDRYLSDLRVAAPVLDLGCGRGELLLLLREAGIEATGIEGDGALVQAAARRGLTVIQGDVLEVLRAQETDSQGAVTAIHLFEHLTSATLVAVLAEVKRVLRRGGLLIAECPNPHTLRVGATLFWQDPTHSRPLLPETLELFIRAAGLTPTRRKLLHPFPDDQLLADDEGGTQALTDPDITTLAERVDRLRSRLDEILNGPRDFAVWAENTEADTHP